MDLSHDTYVIGPVSGGDRKAIKALADSLLITNFDDNDCVVVGPMSGGDRRTVISKAESLGLGVKPYVCPKPVPEPKPEPPKPEVKPEQKPAVSNLEKCLNDIRVIVAKKRDCREKSLALTKLDEFEMWISRA